MAVFLLIWADLHRDRSAADAHLPHWRLAADHSWRKELQAVLL